MARVWKFGEQVDTDQILPGRYAPYMTSEAEFANYVFVEARPEFSKEVQPGDIIVAGRNFGCGSSREYAPQALKNTRIGGIIAPSFGRIFFRNALSLGIPLFEADLTGDVEDGDEVTLDIEKAQLVTARGTFQLKEPPQFVREIWREGSLVGYYQKYGRFPGEE